MPPAATNADLLPHEIVGPVWYLPYPLPVMIAAGAVLLVLLGLAVWALVRWRRLPEGRSLHPREAALAALALLSARADAADAYEFSIAVCEIVRGFLAVEHRLPAPKLTTYEFLQAAQQGLLFEEDRMVKLSQFLEKVDAIKFARVDATGADNAELAGLAEDLVKGEVRDAVAA